jgi:hypothetical protein
MMLYSDMMKFFCMKAYSVGSRNRWKDEMAYCHSR